VEVLHLDRGVRGTVEPATVVDHVTPHKGDWTDFITGELALRWRCSVYGTSAIMKISTLAAVCDGERIRGAEPQGDPE
jgi:hypothetical protein